MTPFSSRCPRLLPLPLARGSAGMLGLCRGGVTLPPATAMHMLINGIEARGAPQTDAKPNGEAIRRRSGSRGEELMSDLA